MNVIHTNSQEYQHIVSWFVDNHEFESWDRQLPFESWLASQGGYVQHRRQPDELYLTDEFGIAQGTDVLVFGDSKQYLCFRLRFL